MFPILVLFKNHTGHLKASRNRTPSLKTTGFTVGHVLLLNLQSFFLKLTFMLSDATA